MEDKVADLISNYVKNIGFEELPNDTIHEVKRRILDSIGCYLGAISSETWRIAAKVASMFKVTGYGASIWASDIRTLPDWATFVNGVGIRYLDFNDTYLSKEPLHPSDMIAAALSVGETRGSSGKELIEAVALGYEIAMRLCDAASLRKQGWDHVNYTMIGAVVAASKLLELNSSQIKDALALAVVPHASMRQTRAGELSMWKGSAAANSCRNAVFACLLASEGFTGPVQPFEGEMGFIKQVSRILEYRPLEELRLNPKPKKMLESYMKFYPVEYHAQSAVEAAIQISHDGVSAENIERVEVETFDAAYEIIVKDPEKWRPKTRETADHSLPYCVAYTLIHGDIWMDAFDQKSLQDPKVHALISKISIKESAELTRLYPEGVPTILRIRLKDGRTLERRVDYPIGHVRNPPTDDMVEGKFNRLTQNILSKTRKKQLVETILSLEKISDVGQLVSSIQVGP